MPWTTPALRDVRSMVRDAISGRLPGADASVRNSVMRVLSDAMGALCHLCLQYLDWLAKQLLPDTAEGEWLSRHANIWLTNFDGSTGRKLATLASGQATFTAIGASVTITSGTQLSYVGTEVLYATTANIVLASGGAPTAGPIQAIDPGMAGNLDAGTVLTLISPVAGVNSDAVVVELDGGADDETDDELRPRLLHRIQQPPMGGAEADYEQWALAVPGVTRAWAANDMGMGTATVRFLEDDLRAADDGWPTTADIARVADYIDKMRPVTVKDCFVVAPIKQFLDVTIQNLVPDTTSIRSEIEASLQSMLMEKASPGQTIYEAWISAAISNAPLVESFDLMMPTSDFVMASAGNMAVLETILYE